MQKILRALVLLIALVLILMLGACARPTVRFIPDGGEYTYEEVERRARSADLGDLPRTSASEITDARRRALVQLRQEGEEGQKLAVLLTDFPVSAGVPAEVEGATVDGRRVWVVVEASPGSDEKLSRRRLWILDRTTGDIVSSAAFR